jgi:Raf kinase inhibitor-like YbhB/YbcL family protein
VPGEVTLGPPTLPRVKPVPAVLLAGVVVLAASCDTGDGKQLQPYDPADYPSNTVATTEVDATAQVDEAGELPPRASLVPEVPGNADATGGFTLTAPWGDGATIDVRNTCDGLDVAPALSWSGVPEGTVEIAISLVDDSAVSEGQPFVHWVIGGLDPADIALVEGDVPPGAVQALNFFGDVGYGGPCPPPGDDAHLYRLTAYALNKPLQLADGTLAIEFLDAIATATIGSTDLTGFASR